MGQCPSLPRHVLSKDWRPRNYQHNCSLVHLELTNTKLLNKNDNGVAPPVTCLLSVELHVTRSSSPFPFVSACWKHSIASWESDQMQESDCMLRKRSNAGKAIECWESDQMLESDCMLRKRSNAEKAIEC